MATNEAQPANDQPKGLSLDTIDLLGKIRQNAEEGVEDWHLLKRFLKEAELDGATMEEAIGSAQYANHQGYLQRTLAQGRRYPTGGVLKWLG